MSDKKYFLVLCEISLHFVESTLYNSLRDIPIGVKYTVLSHSATIVDRNLVNLALTAIKKF